MPVPRRRGRETRLKTDCNERVGVYRVGPLVRARALHWPWLIRLELTYVIAAKESSKQD